MYVRIGDEAINYRLLFLDDTRQTKDVWEAHFESEDMAIWWMWIISDVWAVKQDWSVMELKCHRCRAGCLRSTDQTTVCCIARIPASTLRPVAKAERPQPRPEPSILIVAGDNAAAASIKNAILCVVR